MNETQKAQNQVTEAKTNRIIHYTVKKPCATKK